MATRGGRGVEGELPSREGEEPYFRGVAERAGDVGAAREGWEVAARGGVVS